MKMREYRSEQQRMNFLTPLKIKNADFFESDYIVKHDLQTLLSAEYFASLLQPLDGVSSESENERLSNI